MARGLRKCFLRNNFTFNDNFYKIIVRKIRPTNDTSAAQYGNKFLERFKETTITELMANANSRIIKCYEFDLQRRVSIKALRRKRWHLHTIVLFKMYLRVAKNHCLNKSIIRNTVDFSIVVSRRSIRDFSPRSLSEYIKLIANTPCN